MTINNNSKTTSNNEEIDLSVNWEEVDSVLSEIISEELKSTKQIVKNETVKYCNQIIRDDNWIVREVTWEELDKFDFEKKVFFEMFSEQPKYVHLFFDFDSITDNKQFDEVFEWLTNLEKIFGEFSYGGYSNDESFANNVGFRYLPNDKHFLSMHVVYYQTKILYDELIEIMKHTAKKGFAYNGVHELVDHSVYSSNRLFRHVCSAKIYTANTKHKDYQNNRKNQGTLLNGTPSQHTITVHGEEKTITREQWSKVFTPKKKPTTSTTSKQKNTFNKQQPAIQESVNRSIGDNYEIVNDVIVLTEEQLLNLLEEFPKSWEGLHIVRPILFNSPYEEEFVRNILEKWYYSREEPHKKPYPGEGKVLEFNQENSSKYFFSLLNHLEDDVRIKYLAKLPKYINAVDYSVTFEANSSFSIKDIREKNYQLPNQKYGVRVGEFLTDLRRIFVFIDCGNPSFILKKYDALNDAYSLEYLSFQSAKELLKSIKLGKCMKSFNEKTITGWDIYDAGKNKNIFRRDDMCFYSPKPNIFSYFTGYNYIADGEIDQTIIQPFLDHVMNIICDNNKELYDYILSWFSYIVQKPAGKTGVAIVIIGEQGTGKNIPFTNVLCHLLGVYANSNVNAIENIVGKFNTSLENKKLIICNELTSADANKYLDSDKLKSVLTEERVEVNQKCVAIRSIENVANLIFVSNDNVPVKIERGDRRYVVTHTSSARKGDEVYFTKLINSFTENFYENLFRYFAQRDISNWNNRKLPQTEAKNDIIEASRSSYEYFISNKKTEFMKEGGYQCTEAYMDYQNYAKKFGYTGCSQKKFGSEIKKYCERLDKKVYGKHILYYRLKDEYVDSFEEVIEDEEIHAFEEL